MKIFKRFLADQLLFSVIYILAMSFVIGFYALTVDRTDISYPILLAFFFYILYMVIKLCVYVIHSRNVKRLRSNYIDAHSSRYEYQSVYEAFGEVYRRFNDCVAATDRKSVEDKRFILSFVHNLKTPVTVSSLILQRCQTGEISEAEALAGIGAELDRLTSDLDMLLDLQRLDELQNDYLPELVNLTQAVTDIINSNRSLFINSRVFPKFSAPDIEAYTDLKWNRILINQLISNAVKYSRGEESKYLYFDLTKEENRVKLVIKDEGIGIPECDISRVFDPFFTGSNGRLGYNSSGVGLYLCSQICDRLGHSIEIENDNGCRVTISYLSKL